MGSKLNKLRPLTQTFDKLTLPVKASSSPIVQNFKNWLHDELAARLRKSKFGNLKPDHLFRVAEYFCIEQQEQISTLTNQEAQMLSELWVFYLNSIDQTLGNPSGTAIAKLPQVNDLLERLASCKRPRPARR